MSRKSLKTKVNEIPASGEWWHPDNGVIYLALAKDLVDRGWSEDEALDLLTSAYGAAADEFGG